jgi:hypothetical protein
MTTGNELDFLLTAYYYTPISPFTYMHFLPLPTFDLLGLSAQDPLPKPDEIQSIAKKWFENFAELIQNGNAIEDIVSLFVDISPTWRDLLALSWDFRTVTGKSNIRDFLGRYLSPAKLGEVKWKNAAELEQPWPDVVWIRGEFTFITEHGIGSAIFRLVPTSLTAGHQAWELHGIFTNLEDLKCFPERIGTLREQNPSFGKWADNRAKELATLQDPQVLIVGGAQSGLMSAARLKYLGVSALVIEKQPRVGDQWRRRYNTLSLIDPVWYDHMPYIP